MLLGLYVIGVVVAVVALLRGLHTDRPASDQAAYKAVVGLRAAQRRLELAQFKAELRRDAAHFWRELDKIDQRKRGQP